MNNCFRKAIVIGSIIVLTAVTISSAGGRWNRVAPQGAGFSIEAPGEAKPTSEPGQYEYASGLWFLGVKIQSVDPHTRQLVERRDRKALVKCLELVRDVIVDEVKTRRSGSSSGETDGYPSLRFSIESDEIEATNLLVLTSEHLYLVMTVGPKGSSKDDAKRFLKSFRLETTSVRSSADSNAPTTSPANPVAAKLAGPMLAVARLIVEEKINPRIDEALLNAPPAAGLGNRWGPSNAAWQDARKPISSRIERIGAAYDRSGDVVRTLESELGELTPESQAAFAAALNGPAGPAIVRELARFQFASAIMAEDPNGPNPGDRAWMERLRALQTVFDQRIGAALPGDDGSHAADVEAFFSASSGDASRICLTVVGKATRELEFAINLMMFDDSEAIGREIETVIARAK
jgi:hypothetical protein